MSSTHRLTRGSVRRALALSAAGAMVFALTPVQSAFAQTEPGARNIEEADDPCVEHQDGSEAFEDINDDDFNFAAECLNDLNIARGYGDNEYRPGVFVKREQMASFISRKLESAVEYNRPDDAPEANFTDREKIAQVHVNNVDILADLEIVQGYTDGSYRPGADVTRGQMASFIVREMAEIVGEENLLDPSADYFSDDDGTEHENNINIVAEYGIAQGTGDGFEPNAFVTRGQMAAFIARNIDALNNEHGITFEPVVDAPEPTPTNQTFTATTGGGDVVLAEGEQRDFVFDVGDAAAVDLALFACDDLTVGDDGNVVFDQSTTNPGTANRSTVQADIIEVNGVVVPANTTHVDNEAAQADGTVSVTIQGDAATSECVVVVVWDDADDDERVDVDANGLPTEDFGISGETLFATVRGLNATPETATNRFGTQHTVTATLIDEATPADEDEADTVPMAGETIRFQVFRGTTTSPAAPGGTFPNETCSGTVIASGTATTDGNGQATFTYTGPNDPSATNNADEIDDCIIAFYDRNENGVRDAGDEADAVAKTWAEAAGALQLNAAPDQDTNAVNTRHTVTATVQNQFGEPAANQTVVFEVYRDVASTTQAPEVRIVRTTNSNGVATLTYTGPPDAAHDEIVVCLDTADATAGTAANDCDVVITEPATGTFVVDSDEAEFEIVDKYWVEPATAADDATADEVLGFDVTADFVDVEGLRFLYDTNDQFFVDCFGGTAGTTAATYQQFEQALSVGDTLTTVNYDPDASVNRFHLVDEDDSSPLC